MKKTLRDRLTYANVVSTLCLFLLLGGGAAYAASRLPKNSVGTKQLKKGAVTGQKVAANTLTGANINASTLGLVPDAKHADSADTATNAAQLGGSPPSSYKDKCPDGTTSAAADFCVSADIGLYSWVGALEACAARGFRLPEPAEAYAVAAQTAEEPEFWTDDFWTDEKGGQALSFVVSENGLFALDAKEGLYTYCVVTPHP